MNFKEKYFEKSSIEPSKKIVPYIWYILYPVMFYALYKVLNSRKNKDKTLAIVFFSMQFVLNIMWPFIAFKFKKLGLSYADTLLLLVTVILTTVEFYKHDKTAAYIMLPYVFWTCFASVVNGTTAVFNNNI